MSLPPEDRLPEDLRNLQLARPRAALRQDTLRTLRLALDEPPPGHRWWESWRVELTLGGASAIAFCLLSLCLGSPACQLPKTLLPTSAPPGVVSTPMTAELEELGPYATRAHRAYYPTSWRFDHAVLTHDDLEQF